MKKILFVTYGGGHINIVTSLVKEIEKHNDFDYNILALNTAIPYVQKTKLKYNTLVDFLPFFNNKERIIDIGKKLALKYHNPNAGFSIKETCAYLGCGMYDLEKKYGEENAIRKFQERGRNVFCQTTIMDQILDREKPTLVITTVSKRMELATVLEAKKRGIKTIFIHNLHYLHNCEKIFLDNIDYHFVMNKNVKSELINCGVNHERIFITGQPAFDYLLAPISETKRDICNKLSIDYKTIIIVWIVDNSIVLNDTTINEVVSAINYYKKYQFILKLHPNENNVQKFKKIALDYSNVIVLKDYDNRKLLEIGDVFIVGVSTMGLEISFYDKDIIELCLKDDIFSDKNIKYRYDMLKIAIPVLNKGCLIKQINNIFTDRVKNYLKSNRKIFWEQKGYAAHNCYQILKIISNIQEGKNV